MLCNLLRQSWHKSRYFMVFEEKNGLNITSNVHPLVENKYWERKKNVLFLLLFLFQILRVKLESKSPSWKLAPLKETILKNRAKTQILIFKELTWDTVKIEARSTMDKSLPPLRLLTNQAKCRITIKKRISGEIFNFK